MRIMMSVCVLTIFYGLKQRISKHSREYFHSYTLYAIGMHNTILENTAKIPYVIRSFDGLVRCVLFFFFFFFIYSLSLSLSRCISIRFILFSWKTSCLITLRANAISNSLDVYLNLKLKLCAKATSIITTARICKMHSLKYTHTLNANTIKVSFLWLWSLQVFFLPILKTLC